MNVVFFYLNWAIYFELAARLCLWSESLYAADLWCEMRKLLEPKWLRHTQADVLRFSPFRLNTYAYEILENCLFMKRRRLRSSSPILFTCVMMAARVHAHRTYRAHVTHSQKCPNYKCPLNWWYCCSLAHIGLLWTVHTYCLATRRPFRRWDICCCWRFTFVVPAARRLRGSISCVIDMLL